MGKWLGADLEAQRTSIRDYRQTGQNRVFCEACHGKLVHSSLVFLFRTVRVATVQWFGKKSGAYHTSFNHQRSTKRPKSNAKMYVDQRREDWRENESTHYVTIISVRNTGTSTVFRAHFSTTFRWRIFLKPTGIDKLVPQEPISVKNSKSTNSPNSFKILTGKCLFSWPKSGACRWL